MLTFLFWNLANRDIAPVVAALALEHKVDILMLVENAIPPARLLRLLNPKGAVRYNFVPSRIESKIQIFFGFAPQFLQAQTDTGRATIRKVMLPGRLEFLLCGVHFQSLVIWEERDQALESSELNRIIRTEEIRAGHSRTVVVGDLNMNPFALGLTSASGFNAVMTREIALQGGRRLSEREHPFFYNPMWSQFSDGSVQPGGTFFHNPSGYSSIYWHMLDQVLVRPELVQHFDLSNLKILSQYQRGSLLGKNGRPSVSDHLPITFKLNL
jgi:endonuclease/exonuclease/phosphatase family metal-dependent hydrolase